MSGIQVKPTIWQSVKAKFSGYEVLVPSGPQTVVQGTTVTYKASFFLFTAGCSTGLLLLLCAVLLLFSGGPVEDLYEGIDIQTAPYVRYHLDDHWHGWSSIEHMVIFGDSWTATRFDPKGQRPTPEHPMGNPPFPGETSSNVENWVGYLITEYNQSVVLTADFAIGGATIEGVEDGDDRTLVLQVRENFASLHNNTTGDVVYDWRHNTSIFALWIGINDIVDHWDKKTSFDDTFGLYADLIDELYQTGARNFFIIDVPPLEYSPLGAAHNDFDGWRKLVKDYNHRVDQLTWNFTQTYHDVTTFHFSSYQLLDDIMEDPCTVAESCDIKVTKDYCDKYAFNDRVGNYSDPDCEARVDQYLWLNPLHITTVGHKAIASAISAALQVGLHSIR